MNLMDLAARASRPSFVPFVYRLAARLEQVPEKELLESPTLLATALRNAHRLFGYDAVVSHFDLGLAADACGDLPADRADQVVHQGRWPVVLEGTRRLVKELGQRAVIVGVLTGPLSLARQLGDASVDRAARAALALGRAYAEGGVGALVVAEERALSAAEEQVLGAALRPVWNLLAYYQITPLVAAKGAPLGFAGGPPPPAPRLLTLPESLFAGPAEAAASLVERLVAEAGPGPLLLSTAWEVPPATAPEVLHAVMRAVTGGPARRE